MKKGTGLLIFAAIILLIIGFVVPVTVHPTDDMRMIIDHTKKVYVTPSCFDQANLTNNLEETTLKFVRTLTYEPESECTIKELEVIKKPFLIAIFQ